MLVKRKHEIRNSKSETNPNDQNSKNNHRLPRLTWIFWTRINADLHGLFEIKLELAFEDLDGNWGFGYFVV
jgi:hypothetical protein